MRRGCETFHQKFGSPKKSCVVPRLRAVTCSSLEPPEAWIRQTAFEENLAPGVFLRLMQETVVSAMGKLV